MDEISSAHPWLLSGGVMEVGLSLGSNQGDRLAHMKAARDRILSASDVRFVAQSPLYETEPVGVRDEFRDLKFLNAVLVMESARLPERWLANLRELEYDMGRLRGADRNAPRPIDVDILYIDDQCIDSGGLVVPHPRWAERCFVVQPLADVRPDLVLPGMGRSVRQVLGDLGKQGVVLFARDW